MQVDVQASQVIRHRFHNELVFVMISKGSSGLVLQFPSLQLEQILRYAVGDFDRASDCIALRCLQCSLIIRSRGASCYSNFFETIDVRVNQRRDCKTIKLCPWPNCTFVEDFMATTGPFWHGLEFYLVCIAKWPLCSHDSFLLLLRRRPDIDHLSLVKLPVYGYAFDTLIPIPPRSLCHTIFWLDRRVDINLIYLLYFVRTMLQGSYTGFDISDF